MTTKISLSERGARLRAGAKHDYQKLLSVLRPHRLGPDEAGPVVRARWTTFAEAIANVWHESTRGLGSRASAPPAPAAVRS